MVITDPLDPPAVALVMAVVEKLVVAGPLCMGGAEPEVVGMVVWRSLLELELDVAVLLVVPKIRELRLLRKPPDVGYVVSTADVAAEVVFN